MKRFGTFEGVFTPCLLSILGVIMYLRLGWVVGHAGLGGTLIIIALANVITLITALSMSSVVTNIRIGPGGAYSIITKSLGIEAGGAIGIPLYISQALSVAFYIAGFTECWHFVFPHHNVILIPLVLWLVLLLVTYFSTKMAFRIQFVIMAFIVLSLISIFLGKGTALAQPSALENIQILNFREVFAIFFPAVTGILAGASMSGELKDPRRSIPLGTLSAIGVSLCIYISLAYWFAEHVDPLTLKTNTNVAIELGRWRSLVILGVMGATLSSALSMFVSSPRILLALSKHSILPFSSSLARINKRGEPTLAILLTSLIILIPIMVSSLNQIAALLTMIFLITYGMINLTVFIEQSMGIVSFRPSFRVPKTLSLLGSVGCIAIMFFIDVRFSLIAFLVIVLVYYVLIKKGAQIYSPDIRSGILVFLAEKMAQAAGRLPYYPKIWKPNLVIPVTDFEYFTRIISFIRTLVYPAGRITIFKVIEKDQTQNISKTQLYEKLTEQLNPLREEGIFVESSVVEAQHPLEGVVTVMQTVKGLFFPPNSLFYTLDEGKENDDMADTIIEEASNEGLGIILLLYHAKVGFAQEKIVNLWIRKQSPNVNLSILMALQLERNWEGHVRIVQAVDEDHQKNEAVDYLTKLKDIMRLSQDVSVEVLVGNFKKALKEAPPADINIFGMQDRPQMKMIREISDNIQTSVLFLRDSKHESALA